MKPETFALRIERSFAAPREAVFGAFTEAALRSQWLDQEQGWPAFLDQLGKLLDRS
jgi:uncharacterized protein YndB with AHSA1/START domain